MQSLIGFLHEITVYNYEHSHRIGAGLKRSMRATEALALAAAEGLTLARAPESPTGFWGVSPMGAKFKAQIRTPSKARGTPRGNPIYVGSFESAEEAALTIARKFPDAVAERIVMQEEVKAKATVKLTAEDVLQIANTEGLTLLHDESSPTGFQGVQRVEVGVKSRPFRAQVPGRTKGQGGHAGYFESPHEAALAIARRLGPERSAALAAAGPTNRAGWQRMESREQTSAQAKCSAWKEGLVLRRKMGSQEYWGVNVLQGSGASAPRWRASIYVGREYVASECAERDGAGSSGDSSLDIIPWRSRDRKLQPDMKPLHPNSLGEVYLGCHASAEGAALTIARCLRSDPMLMARVVQLQEMLSGRQRGPSYRKRKREHPVREESDAETQEEDAHVHEREVDEIIEVEAIEAWSDDDEHAIEVDAWVVPH